MIRLAQDLSPRGIGILEGVGGEEAGQLRFLVWVGRCRCEEARRSAASVRKVRELTSSKLAWVMLKRAMRWELVEEFGFHSAAEIQDRIQHTLACSSDNFGRPDVARRTVKIYGLVCVFVVNN